MEIIEMAKGRKTGGRKPGSLNQSTLVGKGISAIMKNMMGIDDEALARTGQINRAGYGFRRRWQEILDGKRTPDPAYTSVVKLSLAYAVGNPGKLQEVGEKRQSLIFLGIKPWEMDNMKAQTDAMIAQADAEERLKLEEAKKPVVIEGKANTGDTDLDTLEVVQPLPPEDPSAYR